MLSAGACRGIRNPDTRQKQLQIRSIDGKELYVGLGSAFLFVCVWGGGRMLERQVALSELAC